MAAGTKGVLCVLLLLLSISCQISTCFDFNKLANGLNLPNLNSTLINGLIKNGLNQLQKILGKTFNFGNIAKGTQLVLDNLQLNRANLRLGATEANKLLGFLHGFSLEDRVKAWGLMAKYGRLFERSLKKWNVEDLHVFENDILLTVSDIKDLIKEAEDFLRSQARPARSTRGTDNLQIPHLRQKRKITSVRKEKWGRVIPWRFHHKFASNEQAMIRRALQHWEEETCLSFVEAPNTNDDHLSFIKDGGCYSYIGKQGGAQDVSIDAGCFNFGIIVHEIGHALGMWHEQSRPDRDLYVSLLKNNIDQGDLAQFQTRTWEKTMSIGVPYDYGSVMHYGRKDFSTGFGDTIKTTAFGYQQTIGQLRTATFHDVKIINFHYCADLCGSNNLEWSKCERDGYKNPQDCGRCKCAEGFKGQFCQEIEDQSTAECGANELKAETGWKTLTSPGHSFRMVGPATCYWKITAPKGSNVRIEFLKPFSFPAPPRDACTNYIEVKYKDLALTGPRFCGVNRPLDPILSEDHGTMLLLFRSTSSTFHAGFKLRYRAESCGQCFPGAPAVQPACVTTHRYTCYGTYKCNWLGKKLCKRFNTCLKTIYTCCPGFTRNGKTCTRK